LSAKGGGKGAVRSMRYLQFIAAMGIRMRKSRKVVGGEADGASQTTEERTVHGPLSALWLNFWGCRSCCCFAIAVLLVPHISQAI